MLDLKPHRIRENEKADLATKSAFDEPPGKNFKVSYTDLKRGINSHTQHV